MLIKAFLMMVLIFQLGLDGQSQPTSMGDLDVDDVTATSGSGSGTSGSGTGGTGSGGSTYTGGAADRRDTPIDGGLSFLLAAGIGYGLKKVKDNKRKKV